VDEFHNLCILVLTFPTYVAGVNVKVDTEALKTEVPHIVVGTPGRVLDLATKRNVMDLSKVITPVALCCGSTRRVSLSTLRRAAARTRVDAGHTVLL
jgi:hypothetical protein